MKSFRDIRVIPVVLVAIFGLAVLKIAGLVIDGGYVFDYQPNSRGAMKQASWAQEMLNYPGGPKGDPADITGSAPANAVSHDDRSRPSRSSAEVRSTHQS